MAIQMSDVDGVPTLLAPTAGQMNAGLVFRVGRADEALSRSGLTHLVEHLALFPLGLTDYHYNGATGAVTTSFHTAGSEQDVVSFLTRVCDGLAELPLHRLETEKSIVRTEWSSRTPAMNESMDLWRYGARGYGLMSYREPGTYAISAEDVLRWRDTWFTRENVVLWIAGERVPPDLRLRLPTGRRQPVPVATSALPATPAYFTEGRQGVVFDAVVRDRSAAWVFAEVLERSLYRDLRQDGGYSYAANAMVDRRGDGCATVIAAVDALPEQQAAAVGGCVDVLAKLRVGRVEQADVDSYLAKLREAVRHPDTEARILQSAAFSVLTGERVRGVEERLADTRAVTVDEVHEVAQEAMQSVLLKVPAGQRADWAGFTPAPTRSAFLVDGARYPGRGEGSAELILGADGVTAVSADTPVTVRYDQVAAASLWPDGARQLVGHDGFVLRIEPTLSTIDAAAIARLDAAIDESVKIRMPPRDPGSIPQPDSPPVPAGARPSLSGWEIAVLVISVFLTTAVFCVATIFTAIAADENGSPDDIGWGPSIMSWLCMLAFAVPAARVLLRRLRRRR